MALRKSVQTLSFEEAELAKAIQHLSPQARSAFAAACAQRLLPCYSRFSKRTGRGDPTKLAAALGRLWDDLSGSPMSDAEIEAEIKTCMALIPQEDDGPWVMEQAAAEDAASALAYALRCRENGLASEAAWAARRAYEAVTYFCEHLEDNNTGKVRMLDYSQRRSECARHLANPLVQAELARQQRDLDELLRDAITVPQLRKRSREEAAEFLPS
jgi:uncharacterized protein YjaG (DUF416 family)